MGRLENKVALVTGGARGIGRGIALCLAAEGADIVVLDSDLTGVDDEVTAAVAAHGRRTHVIQADAGSREEMESAFCDAIDHFGRLDIAVANAAHSVRELVIEAKWENVRRTIEVTQFGVFHTCQLAAQQMVKQGEGGKIIITGSVHQEFPFAMSAAYNMAKAAINHLARTMAGEVAQHKINVNVINPGWINTPGERKYSSKEDIAEGGKLVPWGRIGEPEDIGRTAAFLASSDADYITGASIKVDGGFLSGLKKPEK